MRAVLAAVVIVSSSVALPGAADARKGIRSGHTYGAHTRYYQPRSYYYGQPGYDRQPGYAYRQPNAYSSEQAACEARAQAEDPAGIYAGYPCWARSTFGRGSGGRR